MLKELAGSIKGKLQSRIKNQDSLTDMALTALFAGGHVLIEGVPGLAKTLWARSLAQLLDVSFKRVQFTSDLMPADIVGTKVFNEKSGDFELRRGPLFTQLFLADEINRTPPKTQSALLEAMEEGTITIDGQTHKLAAPFFLMATQNPIEYEGTYPLPEALMDRFMMKLVITYPGVSAERDVLKMHNESADVFAPFEPMCSGEQIFAARAEAARVRVEDSLFEYIVSIVETTRRIGAVLYGASPRGSISLLLASKAYAAICGRDSCTPDDVREVAKHVLCHRIILKPEAEIEGIDASKVLDGILQQVRAPH